jgi:ATP:ADP antiporter, AAA family
MSHASHLDGRRRTGHRCRVTRRSELVVVAWAAATFGAVMAAYSAFRPVRESIIVGRDPDHIPWLFLATLLVTLAVSSAWGKAVARSPRHLVAITFHVFAVCSFGFAVAHHSDLDPVAVGRVFYVWGALFSLFVVSVFWSLLADLLGPASASRLYGPIAAGGTIGTMVGPALTRALVEDIGDGGVLVMSGILLELAALFLIGLRRAAADVEAGPFDRGGGDRPVAGGAFDGLTRVARSPYLRSIVGYVLCTSITATFIYLQRVDIVKGAKLADHARTQFFASIDLWVAVCAFVLQTLLAAPLIKRFGPGRVLCVLPVIQLAGLSVLVAKPDLDTVFVVLVAGAAATHGLTRPARELLFTVIGRDDKYRAKNVIDTVGYRLGDTVSGFLGQGLGAVAGGLLVGVAGVIAVGWIALASLLGAGFRRSVKETS